MADKRPKRQRKVRSATEFFGGGMLHKEEVELRRALQASLKEAYQKKQEKPAEAVISARSVCTNTKAFEKEQDKPAEPVATRSICTGTNTRFRIKSSVRKKLKNAAKQCGDLPGKIAKSIEERESGTSQGTSPVLTKPLKRKDVAEITFSSVKKKKKESEKGDKEGFPKKSNEGSTKLKNRKGVGKITDKRKDDGKKMKKALSEAIARKDLKSPGKTSQVAQSSKGKELMILPKSKATVHKLLNKRKIKDHQKSKVVQSLTEKFSATVRDGKQPATGFMKKDREDQMDTDSSNDKTKKKTGLQNDKVEKLEQSSGPSNDSSSKTNKICELRQQVSNSLQGKVRRRLKHKFKNRRLVSPLGEIYIPANIAKTEDFLTFLCLRGNSSLPRCFDVFNNPDPFFTQPAHDSNAVVSFPALPMQSSVIYSPPSSSAPSESSAASPMSSVDGWVINED